MHFFKKIRIGQRAVKTALSVGIALAVAQILGSSLPIFAAIGAISVMSRTWSDSLKESLTQVAGTFLGYRRLRLKTWSRKLRNQPLLRPLPGLNPLPAVRIMASSPPVRRMWWYITVMNRISLRVHAR